ncbi:hypothetical protein F5Y19DRAFT_490064 [Xylariaceae sp. FL1651]|nr:hypothetical protein F5Y19DRAFT_490064 [Xylariaceae sp. FL1651]
MLPQKGVKRGLDGSIVEGREQGPKRTTPLRSSISQSSKSPKASNDEQILAGKKLAARKSATPRNGSPSTFYIDALKTVDKTFNQLVKKYQPNPNGLRGITADDFAVAMARLKPLVEKLQEDSPSLAFDLLMDLGEHAYGELDACVKSAGFGDTDDPFKSMDKLLVEVITARREEQSTSEDAGNASKSAGIAQEYKIEPSKADFGGEERALRDQLGSKHPNKRERTLLGRARLADLKAMFDARRKRRETAEDWAGNTLNDLTETRARIDGYGIGEHFFRVSADLLASIKGVERPPLQLERIKGYQKDPEIVC